VNVLPGMCALLIAGLVSQVASPEGGSPRLRMIDGRTHPELIPPEQAWEAAFDVLATSSEGLTLEGLSRYNLHIPLEDARFVRDIASETFSCVTDLRGALDGEHRGTTELSAAERERIQAAIPATVLAGRAKLVDRLPRRSMKAVETWLARSILPGMQVWVPQ
jgi:hypothetical protein